MKNPNLQIIDSESPLWSELARGFAAAPNYGEDSPRAVVMCRSISDVQQALRHVVEQNIPFRVRGGRHNYEGHSSRVKNGLIIDISGFKEIEQVAPGKFRLGAGLNMFELTEALNRHGRAIPYATGGTVGLAGFLLGGGIGVNSRLWGTGSIHVEEFDLVMADSQILSVSPETFPDLFWAVLGAGAGNFGVVTSLTVRTHEISDVSLLSVTWDFEKFEELVDVWQRGVSNHPRELATYLSLKADGEIELTGQWTGEADEFQIRHALASIFVVARPKSEIICQVPHAIATRLALMVSDEYPSGWHDAIGQELFKSTSSFAYEPLPLDAIRIVRERIECYPRLHQASGEMGTIRLLGGGGAIADLPPFPVAMPHQNALLLLQFNGYWTSAEDKMPVTNWTNQTRKALAAFTKGAYSGYNDDEIPLDERNHAYYGELAPRIAAIKDKYDPDNRFRFPHGLTCNRVTMEVKRLPR